VKLQWISQNPNITMNFIENHLNKPWNIRELFKNEFLLDKKAFLEEKEKDFFMKRIRSSWKEELMKKMFHPKNLECFQNWGFGLED